MIVMKFGGTSVGNPERIRDVLSIVRSRLDQEPALVVSALGGVTDMILRKLDEAVSTGKSDVSEVAKRHFEVIDALSLEKSLVDEELNKLERVLSGVALLEECTPRVRSMAVCNGERMSTKIVAAFFTKEGLEASPVDTSRAGLLAAPGYEDARHDRSCESCLAGNILKVKGVPIITGFIGCNTAGEVVTLGRSGSDYSASIVGSALDAKEIQIWTDVDGVMTADPQVVPNAKNIPELSFDEAAEVAYYGARVIHPSTMLPAVEKGIPVRILNTFRPEHPGTVVVKSLEKHEKEVRSLVYKEDCIVLTVTTPSMFQQTGYMERVGRILAAHGIYIDIISTSEVSISMTTDRDDNLEMAVAELSQFSQVSVERDKTIVGIVGEDICNDVRIAARVFGVLADLSVNPVMLSQAATKINMSFVIGNEEIMSVIAALHREFFE